MDEANANLSALQVADEPVLVGREQELSRFKKILADGQPLLVVITGQAGVGKTTLLNAFRTQAKAAGWNTAPPSAAAETLRVAQDTTEEDFGNRVQGLLAMPSGESFIEKSPGKNAGQTSSEQPPLLPLVEQLRASAPLLLLVDGYQPAAVFADWFQNRFVQDVRRAGASVIVVVSELPEWTTKFLSPLADQIITLGTLDEQAIRQHFVTLGEKISPRIEEPELNVYVESAYKKPEMIGSLTRVLRLALRSEA